ncbi:MAG: RluA family pseudouridine synthase [Bdellovibrionota bacterium]
MKSFEFVVAPRDDGSRLDLYLAEHIEGLTRSQVKNLIAQGLVSVDSKKAEKAGSVLATGQSVVIQIPEPKKLDLEPQEVGIKILFEDEHLAVLEKPPGLSVHPSQTESNPTVVHGLLHSLGSLSSVGGVERPGIVHRIDKGTSGVLVVSKTDSAHLALSQQFKAHSIDRRYKALVYGDLEAKLKKNHGRIETLIGRHPTHRKKMTTKVKQGRVAITNWAVLERLVPTRGRDEFALNLVECQLETGRTHQIRVHLSELGFSLVGDPVYGDNSKRAKVLLKPSPELAKACESLDHQLLHAYHLGFKHPATGQWKNFDSDLPQDFADLLDLARTLAR